MTPSALDGSVLRDAAKCPELAGVFALCPAIGPAGCRDARTVEMRIPATSLGAMAGAGAGAEHSGPGERGVLTPCPEISDGAGRQGANALVVLHICEPSWRESAIWA